MCGLSSVYSWIQNMWMLKARSTTNLYRSRICLHRQTTACISDKKLKTWKNTDKISQEIMENHFVLQLKDKDQNIFFPSENQIWMISLTDDRPRLMIRLWFLLFWTWFNSLDSHGTKNPLNPPPWRRICKNCTSRQTNKSHRTIGSGQSVMTILYLQYWKTDL